MKKLLVLLVSISLFSCVQNEKRVSVESLITSSAENASFPIQNQSSVREVKNWVNDDKPTRAIINCGSNKFLCKDVEEHFTANSIDFDIVQSSSSASSVSLLYNRTNAKNCISGFGCDNSANIIQMVTDRSDFVSPSLTDHHDATKAVGTYNSYLDK